MSKSYFHPKKNTPQSLPISNNSRIFVADAVAGTARCRLKTFWIKGKAFLLYPCLRNRQFQTTRKSSQDAHACLNDHPIEWGAKIAWRWVRLFIGGEAFGDALRQIDRTSSSRPSFYTAINFLPISLLPAAH